MKMEWNTAVIAWDDIKFGLLLSLDYFSLCLYASISYRYPITGSLMALIINDVKQRERGKDNPT